MAVDELLWRDCVRLTAAGKPGLLGVLDGNRLLVVDFNEIKLRPDRPHELPEHMDTVEGANDAEAPWCRREFGKNVLIIDSNLKPVCWPFIAYHEAIERRRMTKQGMSYEKAHDLANKDERQLRLRARQRMVGQPQPMQGAQP